jgi:hypothetical protein
MKTAVVCYSLVLVALAIISPTVCYPQANARELFMPQTGELESTWEVMEQQDDLKQYDVEDQQHIMMDDVHEPENNQNEGLVQATTCCLTTLYVMGFTSGKTHAGSDHSPFIEIGLFNGQKKTVRFPDNPGNDMVGNKGDLWVIPFSNFGFKCCVKKGNIESVVVKQGGNDGWNIQSIVTMVSKSDSEKQLLTSDTGVYRWIDGNGQIDQKQFQLTKLDC